MTWHAWCGNLWIYPPSEVLATVWELGVCEVFVWVNLSQSDNLVNPKDPNVSPNLPESFWEIKCVFLDKGNLSSVKPNFRVLRSFESLTFVLRNFENHAKQNVAISKGQQETGENSVAYPMCINCGTPMWILNVK